MNTCGPRGAATKKGKTGMAAAGDLEYQVYADNSLVDKTLDAARADRLAREAKRHNPNAAVVIVVDVAGDPVTFSEGITAVIERARAAQARGRHLQVVA